MTCSGYGCDWTSSGHRLCRARPSSRPFCLPLSAYPIMHFCVCACITAGYGSSPSDWSEESSERVQAHHQRNLGGEDNEVHRHTQRQRQRLGGGYSW